MSDRLVRTQPAQFAATVAAVCDLGGGMRRVTCAAEELRRFVPSGPDEYVGLLMPRSGRPLVLPAPEHPDLRAAVAAIRDDERPALRWYTIRDHDPVLGTVDLDIVTHGDSGPGSAWACRARPGDPVGIRPSGALYDGLAVHGRQLLVADETALPSVAAILDAWGGPHDARDHGVEVHVEVADRAVLDAYQLEDAVVHQRKGRPGSALVPGLSRALGAGGGAVRYAWVCGEGGLVAGVRRTLQRSGVGRHDILACGYWTLGRPRP